MKKTLHGRRHIRARASVKVGRLNRQIRKNAKFVQMIESIDWVEFRRQLNAMLDAAAEALATFAPIFQRAVRNAQADEYIRIWRQNNELR